MHIEIERKFLVSPSWISSGKGVLIRQGYIYSDEKTAIRIRTMDESGVFTLKSSLTTLSKREFEYDIPYDDALAVLESLCKKPPIVKTRYSETASGHDWIIDVFHEKNEGLILAEIELMTEDETFDLPDWINKEVTDDPKYLNSSLYHLPFNQWND